MIHPSRSLVAGFLIAGALFASWTAFAGEKELAVARSQQHKMVFFAVLEGLYEDGASDEAVDLILQKNERWYIHFVYGCPLCIPALDAFLVYRGRTDFSPKKTEGKPNTFGNGLPQEVLEKLRSQTPHERLAAIQALIAKWVGRRLDLMRLNEAERAAWTRVIKEGRARGMELLRGWQEEGTAGAALAEAKGCAMCDGALGACVQRVQGR